MQLLRNTFLLSVDDKAKHTTNIKGHDGQFLTIDADINKWEHVNQQGFIHSVPLSIESRYTCNKIKPIPLKPGDEVIVHFHTTDPLFRVELPEGIFYKCPYYRIWAKVQDKRLIPMEDFLFVKPIMESLEENTSSSGLQTKLYCETKKRKGVLVYVGDEGRSFGLKEGDVVFLTKNTECDVEVMGVKFWRIRIRNVLGIEREGKLIAVPGKILVKKDTIKHSTFEIPEETAMSKEQFGIVIDSRNNKVAKGEKVSYTNNFSSEFELDGEKYSYLTEDNINYVL